MTVRKEAKQIRELLKTAQDKAESIEEKLSTLKSTILRSKIDDAYVAAFELINELKVK